MSPNLHRALQLRSHLAAHVPPHLSPEACRPPHGVYHPFLDERDVGRLRLTSFHLYLRDREME